MTFCHRECPPDCLKEKLEMARRIEELEKQVSEVETLESVTKAILFEDCGNTSDWKDNTNLGKAAITAMRPHIQRWRNDALEAAAVIAERYDCAYAAIDIRDMIKPQVMHAEEVAHPNQSIADTGLSLPIGEQSEI